MSCTDNNNTTTAPDGCKVTNRDERAAQSTSSRVMHAGQGFGSAQGFASPSLFLKGIPDRDTAPGAYLRRDPYGGWRPDMQQQSDDPVLQRQERYKETLPLEDRFCPSNGLQSTSSHAMTNTSTGSTSHVNQAQNSGRDDDGDRHKHWARADRLGS